MLRSHLKTLIRDQFHIVVGLPSSAFELAFIHVFNDLICNVTLFLFYLEHVFKFLVFLQDVYAGMYDDPADPALQGTFTSVLV